MSTHKRTLFQAVLARISFGAVPVDGTYWFDPKDAGIPDPVTSNSPRRCAVRDRAWPPASLSWFVRRP
jgi:DsbC/DsbD-like thiol-disulfide interchange protein